MVEEENVNKIKRIQHELLMITLNKIKNKDILNVVTKQEIIEKLKRLDFLNVNVIAFAMKNPEMYCTNCGNCCKKSSPIALCETDITQLKKIFEDDIIQKFVRKSNKGLEFTKTTPCAFLHKNECSIYNHRPFVCRVYPFKEKSNIIMPVLYDDCDFAKNLISITLLIWIMHTAYERMYPIESAKADAELKAIAEKRYGDVNKISEDKLFSHLFERTPKI